MTHQISSFFGFFLVAMPAGFPSAAPVPSLGDIAGRYTITPSSSIRFRVDQIDGSGIDGQFSSFSGTFNLKTGDIGQSSVDFTLMPDSVETDDARLTAILKSRAVFDSKRFPTISFQSSSLLQTATDAGRITGQLTAKGITRAESFDVRLTDWDGRTIAFNVSGEVLRTPYNIETGTPTYSNAVKFDMTIRGDRK